MKMQLSDKDAVVEYYLFWGLKYGQEAAKLVLEKALRKELIDVEELREKFRAVLLDDIYTVIETFDGRCFPRWENGKGTALDLYSEIAWNTGFDYALEYAQCCGYFECGVMRKDNIYRLYNAIVQNRDVPDNFWDSVEEKNEWMYKDAKRDSEIRAKKGLPQITVTQQ